jgi:hypothetical protein
MGYLQKLLRQKFLVFEFWTSLLNHFRNENKVFLASDNIFIYLLWLPSWLEWVLIPVASTKRNRNFVIIQILINQIDFTMHVFEI